MRVDAQRHITDYVLVDLGLAFELDHDVTWSVEFQHNVMGLAVLCDTVCQRAQAPRLGLDNFAAIIFDDLGCSFCERVDL